MKLPWKRRKDLEEENKRLSQKLNDAEKQVDELQDMLKGGHNCSKYCEHCRYGLPYTTYDLWQGVYTRYLCELENKCTDYKKKGD